MTPELASELHSAMGTGPSRSAVSNLDFEPCIVRKFQSSSRGVMAKTITPPPLRVQFTGKLRLGFSLDFDLLDIYL